MNSGILALIVFAALIALVYTLKKLNPKGEKPLDIKKYVVNKWKSLSLLDKIFWAWIFIFWIAGTIWTQSLWFFIIWIPFWSFVNWIYGLIFGHGTK
jgi:hypothetical protein